MRLRGLRIVPSLCFAWMFELPQLNPFAPQKLYSRSIRARCEARFHYRQRIRCIESKELIRNHVGTPY